MILSEPQLRRNSRIRRRAFGCPTYIVSGVFWFSIWRMLGWFFRSTRRGDNASSRCRLLLRASQELVLIFSFLERNETFRRFLVAPIVFLINRFRIFYFIPIRRSDMSASQRYPSAVCAEACVAGSTTVHFALPAPILVWRFW